MYKLSYIRGLSDNLIEKIRLKPLRDHQLYCWPVHWIIKRQGFFSGHMSNLTFQHLVVLLVYS